MQRIFRIAGSFAIVLTAYFVYAIAVVRYIERPVALPKTASSGMPSGAARSNSRQMAILQSVFPPGSWELDNPKILESDQVKLLIRDYRNLGDGRVELRPCTFILMQPGSDEDEAERVRQAVILQAPQGALLTFDKPFNLGRAEIGRLTAGQLMGPIVIRSRGKSPGPEDDLLIVTRDVQMNEQRIWTPHAVDFRWGPNYGRGEQMHIKLLPGEQGKSSSRGPNVGGIELFELAHVEQLHLELNSMRKDAAKPAKAPGEVERAPRAPAGAKGGLVTKEFFGPALTSRNDMPIEVTCRGPFRCDMSQQVATFEDRVTVWRINPVGQSDQLNCELLSIFFMQKPDAAAGARKSSDKSRPLNLTAQRVEARGNPVTVLAPSERVEARGQRLEYDVQHDRLTLDGDSEVFLCQGDNEIHARGLQYQSAGRDKLGAVAASGPGWLRSRMTNRNGQPNSQPNGQPNSQPRANQLFEARWNEQLRVRPHEQNQLISLTGGAELSFEGMGRLTAKEVHFWLEEIPAKDKAGKTELRPDRMLARDDVRIDSTQLSGAVKQMEVWFEPAQANGGERWRPGSDGGPRTRDELRPTAVRYAAGGGTAAGNLVPPGAPVPRRDFAPPGSTLPRQLPPPQRTVEPLPEGAPVAVPQQHFDVVGRLLRARVLLNQGGQAGQGSQGELAELMIEEGVELSETQTSVTGEKPLRVSGDQLHVVDAMRPYAAVTVIGRPAHFEARGLGLTGSNINLNRGTNRLWIDGAGWMDLPLDRDLEGRPLKTVGQLKVTWKQKMEFDGRTARFEEAVEANSANQNLRTEKLEVRFLQPIQFAGANMQQQPQVDSLFCSGMVLLNNRTVDEKGLASQDSMQVADLAINLQSGATTAGGPGWLRSVRRGGGAPMAMPGAMVGRAAPDPAASSDDGKLTCIQVRFQGSIQGNIKNRSMTFFDQVKTAYAPVDDWNAVLNINQPESLGPRGVVLSCDRISINELSAMVGQRRAMELEAAGNTIIEGSTFTARALRLTYAEVKDLLVLEGDGRTDAELFRQQQAGAERSRVAARKILFWPSTNKFVLDGARSLELSGLPTRQK